MRTRLLSGGTWVCGKTIVPEGLTGPQLSFNFTVRKDALGGFCMSNFSICELGYCPYSDDDEMECDFCPYYVECDLDSFVRWLDVIS